MGVSIDLTEDQLSELKKIESSISSWSSRYALLHLRAKETLVAIDNLYSSRQDFLDKVISASGIDPNKCSDVKVDENNKLIVTTF